MIKVWIMVSGFLFVLAGSLVSASAAEKVYSDADLKNYSSPTEEKSSEYNRQIINKQRAIRASDEQKERMTHEAQERQTRIEADRKAQTNKPHDKVRTVCRTEPGSFKTICEDETEAETRAKDSQTESSHTPSRTR